MGTLYLVRHGQASFGADDYDNLSELGWRQARRLGEYFAAKGLVFDAAITGTLRRHLRTHEGIMQGLGAEPATDLATPTQWPGLNEYDSAAVIAAVHPAPLPAERNPETYRHHFRLLRQGLAAWMAGSAQPAGMPSYPEFVQGVAGALDHVRERFAAHDEAKVLMVSSGGPISTAVGHLLGAPAAASIELNLRIRNSSVTEFAFTPKRHMLMTYNTLPHLDGAEFASWVSYA